MAGHRAAAAAAGTAAVLALASAGVTAAWSAGSTVLLDTVGGSMEQLARDRSGTGLLVGALVVAAKLSAAGVALALVHRPHGAGRLPALLAGGLLTLWGGANVLAGGAVLTGVVDLGPVADPRSLRWHVLFWDPWFLVWGVALLLAVRWSRHGPGAAGPRPR